MALDRTELKKSAAALRENAKLMSSAARHLGAAANDLGRVALPVAGKAARACAQRTTSKAVTSVANTKAVTCISKRIVSSDEDKVRRTLAGCVICGAVAAAGLAIATVAHIVYYANKRRADNRARSEEEQAQEAS